MHLQIEVCPSTSNSLKLLGTLDFNTYQVFLFLVLYTVIPGYFFHLMFVEGFLDFFVSISPGTTEILT